MVIDWSIHRLEEQQQQMGELKAEHAVEMAGLKLNLEQELSNEVRREREQYRTERLEWSLRCGVLHVWRALTVGVQAGAVSRATGPRENGLGCQVGARTST